MRRVAEVEGVAGTAPLSERATETNLEGEKLNVSLWGTDVGGPGTPSDIEEGRLPGPGEALADTSARDAGLTVAGLIRYVVQGALVGHVLRRRTELGHQR